jgi:hypothetical protein
MPGSVGYAIWFLGSILQACVVVCALRRGLFRQYFLLNLYMLLELVVSLGRYRVLVHYGLTSETYRYFYFYSDAILTIGLFFSLINLYVFVFEELKVEQYLRLGAILLLGGTAWFSYAVVNQSSHRILTYFAFELSQNLYFVGLVLTFVLWGALLKLRETRALVVQLVLSSGIYFSALAAGYALTNLSPGTEEHLVFLAPAMGCLLPLSWAYAFWRVPEGTRLTPGRLAMVPR